MQRAAEAGCHHGAKCLAGGGVRFRLWAPAHERIDLVLEGGHPPQTLRSVGEGWHELTVIEAGVGTLYRFRLPDGTLVPDPASRFQPHDVHGPSEVIDPARFTRADATWPGLPWHEAVIYELHIGTFTAAGTFHAVIERLDHLVALGVTALQIMPIADFPGARNWGYDGVLLYAPDSSYGRPEEFRALIEAAHQRGLMVLLDVVYNHFGPDGNFLSSYAPDFFTDRHKTPWGAAINYDGSQSRPVRDFMIENALMWIIDYNLDGLRFDAVHAIVDDSPEHLLNELAARARAAVGRPLHLVLENEENQANRLSRKPDNNPQYYTAQWNDDVHHVLHVAATGESKGYYIAYVHDTGKLGRALAEGFAFQGEVMEYRGTARGQPSAALPPTAFVSFIQNHDQVGNRAFGERISALTSTASLRAIAAVYLLSPQIPMLFMGEEWSAPQPFPFFCDFTGDLADAVRRGRREEFAKFPEFQDPGMRDHIPDPLAPATFQAAKLVWTDRSVPAGAETLAWYTRILATRRKAIIPLIPLIEDHAGQYKVIGEGAVIVTWRLRDGRVLRLAANLSASPALVVADTGDAAIWREGVDGVWTVQWDLMAKV